LADENLIGTALTLQTAIGFSIALITVYLVPSIEEIYGWSNVFFILVFGPIIGIISMVLLRKHPDIIKIANGQG
jgi:dipeptide/tripeptide permease